MKRFHCTLLIGCLAVALFTSGESLARTWTSADGKSSFEGDLISYNAATAEVTVNRNGKKITFKQEMLSSADITFLKNQKPAPAAMPAATKPPISPRPSTPATTNAAANPDEIEFLPRPSANDRRPWTIKNFGPVGIGITLEKGFVMKIKNVEEGSPAAKTGKLQPGQTIESINGMKLSINQDPRQALAKIITDAEANDGKINLQVQGAAPVLVEIPVLGSYSPTWPLNCPKSEKIVRNFADRLAEKGKDGWGSVLFLLSTGEEKDLEIVRGWMKGRTKIGPHNWAIGVQGMGICEYYLRTGDASVLPMIQQGADHLRDTIYNGAWSGRAASFNYQSGGHLNAAGVHCVTFLLLAKTCGVDVDEQTLQSSLNHFFAYSGKGSVPYGDFMPKAGYNDCNGKTGGLAMAMAVAARLTPDGENSIYAQATQVNAMKSYYGTNIYHMGHTGGGIGEAWKSTSMGLMVDKRPAQYRQYMDARKWILELSRRFNGGIGIAGGKEGNYDVAIGERAIDWGTFFALNYTLPRKHLHMYGAPLSKWAKTHALPDLPEKNTAADLAFNSPYPIPGGPWSKDDIYKETIAQHAGGAITKLFKSEKFSDEELQTYLHHPEITHRSEAKDVMLKLGKDGMLLELLRSDDTRARHMGIMSLHELFGTWRRTTDQNKARITAEMMAEVDKIIRNPEESPFTKKWAIGLLIHLDIEKLRGYRDLLVKLIEDPAVQEPAINSSTALYTDPESYKIIFPPTIKAIAEATSFSMAIIRCRVITKALEEASPEIQAYGLEKLKQVYLTQPDKLISKESVYVIPDGAAAKRKAIGTSLAFSDEGRKFVKLVPKETLKSLISGKKEDMYQYDEKSKPNEELVGTWVWCVWPPPKSPDKVEERILEWVEPLAKEKPIKLSETKDIIELTPDGKISKSKYFREFEFWSDDMLVSNSRGTAHKMRLFQTKYGVDFLIVELHDLERSIKKFNLNNNSDAPQKKGTPLELHPGYNIYIREEHSYLKK